MKRGVFTIRFCAMAAFALTGLVGIAGSSYAQQGAGGAIVAVDEVIGAAGGSVKGAGGSSVQTRSGSSGSSTSKGAGRAAHKKVTHTPVAPKATRVVDSRSFNGPVLGDKYTFLNFEVISAQKPTHTIAAKQAGATGLVQVEILISENGNVLAAKARTGNKLLWPEAERAALASKFNHPTVNGQAARAMGFLVYRFGAATDEDEDDE
jgi:hypothetical protein